MTTLNENFKKAVKKLELTEMKIVDITVRIAQGMHITKTRELSSLEDIVKNTIVELAKIH